MITLTEEKRRKAINRAKFLMSVHSPETEDYLLAQIALASLETEPNWYVSEHEMEYGGIVLFNSKGKVGVYTAPPVPVMKLPKQYPAEFFRVVYQECDGFVACGANTQTIWNAAVAAIKATGYPVEEE